VGCSVWRSKKGDAPTVLVPSRSYATAGGVRYYELLRSSVDAASAPGNGEDPAAKLAVRRFKDYVRDEYRKIAALPDEPPVPAERSGGKKAAAR